MVELEQIQELSSGARFYRADLHIHSYEASHDVHDVGATPQAIVSEAAAKGLEMIAIADHNDISNIERAVNAASHVELLIVPAVELSTDRGHLLCYLPDLRSLQQFFGRLDIVDPGSDTSRCQTSILECLNLLEGAGGFGCLAHVDGGKGFETLNAGNSPHKKDVLCHPSLLAIELKASDSRVSYSDIDENTDRRGIGSERVKKLGLGSKQFLARILNSDSHTLDALGRNAVGDKKVTRYKMTQPSFAGLRIALEDADARVRIEEEVPPSVPYIEGVAAEGAFLDGLRINLSRNLTCIIGGRGTGKSTTFEALRTLSGQESNAAIVDSEAWPHQLYLFWRDQAGQSIRLQRSRGGDVVNLDQTDGPTVFHIESSGQGDAATISKQLEENPLALLEYLGRFIDVREAAQQERDARDEILELWGKVQEAQRQVDRIPKCKKDLAIVRAQINAMEKENAKEIIALQRRLAMGSQVRESIVEKLREIGEATGSRAVEEAVEHLVALGEDTDFPVGGDQFKAIVDNTRRFGAAAVQGREGLQAHYAGLKAQVSEQVGAWKASEATQLSSIEQKRKELEAKGVRLDMAFLEKLAADEASLATSLKNLETWVLHRKQIRQKYERARKRRWEARDRIATEREAYAKRISSLLKQMLSDLVVSLKFNRSACAPDVEEQIKAAMDWRTSQVPRAKLLVTQLGVPRLLEIIDTGDVKALQSITTGEGSTVFAEESARFLIERLSEPSVRFALERADVHDLPRLTVTKAVPDAGGTAHYITKDFSKLSLGQQQSTLLSLMLASQSDSPLLIDQPEDNLDGEFIYHSLVPVLRWAKERRQVIIVTHNANIAVLGDAEQIVVLKSTSEKGTVTCRGSIDEPNTRDAACAILEGAKEAFLRRQRIYGINGPSS